MCFSIIQHKSAHQTQIMSTSIQQPLLSASYLTFEGSQTIAVILGTGDISASQLALHRHAQLAQQGGALALLSL